MDVTALFNNIDDKNTGYITRKNLRAMFGEQLNEDESIIIFDFMD